LGSVVTHKFVSAVADGGDATLVRPTNWNDQHAIGDISGTVIVTDAEWINLFRIMLTDTDRITLAGTAHVAIFGFTDARVYNIIGMPFRPTVPFRIPSGYVHSWPGRLILQGFNVRGFLEGDASLRLFDDNSSSRFVLTGTG